MHFDWFLFPLLLLILTIWFSLDRKRRSHKRSWKKMETFWFFRLRVRRAYDSAYDFDFGFSKGHKRSYDYWKPAFRDLEKDLAKFAHYTCKILKITLKQLSKKHNSRNTVTLLKTTVNSVKALLQRLKSITYEWYRKLSPFTPGPGSLRP